MKKVIIRVRAVRKRTAFAGDWRLDNQNLSILVPRGRDTARIVASGHNRFSEQAKSIRFVFSGNHICQIEQESETSHVGRNVRPTQRQMLVLTKKDRGLCGPECNARVGHLQGQTNGVCQSNTKVLQVTRHFQIKPRP